MTDIEPTDCSIYTAAEIEGMASILGLAPDDTEAVEKLRFRLERASFDYSIWLEIKGERVVPSKNAPRLGSLAKRLETVRQEIINLERPNWTNLISTAKQYSDRVGDDRGASRLTDALLEMDWVANCLRDMERNAHNAKSPSGGNRQNDPRHHYYEQIHRIILDFHGDGLAVATDRISGKKQGPLVEFWEFAKKPLGSGSSSATFADAYIDHVNNNVLQE